MASPVSRSHAHRRSSNSVRRWRRTDGAGDPISARRPGRGRGLTCQPAGAPPTDSRPMASGRGCGWTGRRSNQREAAGRAAIRRRGVGQGAAFISADSAAGSRTLRRDAALQVGARNRSRAQQPGPAPARPLARPGRGSPRTQRLFRFPRGRGSFLSLQAGSSDSGARAPLSKSAPLQSSKALRPGTWHRAARPGRCAPAWIYSAKATARPPPPPSPAPWIRTGVAAARPSCVGRGAPEPAPRVCDCVRAPSFEKKGDPLIIAWKEAQPVLVLLRVLLSSPYLRRLQGRSIWGLRSRLCAPRAPRAPSPAWPWLPGGTRCGSAAGDS